MMEAKGFLVLLVFGLLSTALGWPNYCSLQLVPNIQHPITCKNTTSCSQITCSARFGHEPDLRMSVNIDQGQDPMMAYVTLSVPELGFDWSASLKDGENIEIPGFPLKIEGSVPVGQSGMSRLQISLTKENASINFKVDLLSKVEETPYQTTLIEGKIPAISGPKIPSISGEDNPKKFKRLPTVSKVSKKVIITSVVMFLILVILAATLYRCKRKKATTADQLKVKSQSFDEARATSTKTKVPMKPLINEV